MNLVNRVRNILLSPAAEWPVIEREQDTVASIYMKYVLILAAIPAVAGFIGMSVFGIGGFGVRFRMPFVAGLVQMVLTQASTLISWSGYSRCIVRAVNWVDNELNGAYSFDKTEDDGSGNQVTTTQNAVVESPTNNLGYIDNADQGSGGCQGRWVLTEGATSWSLGGPF